MNSTFPAASSTATASLTAVASLTEAAQQREAQVLWAEQAVRSRLEIVKRLRHIISRRSGDFVRAIPRNAADTLVSEVLPLAEACRFLERRAEALLRPRRMSSSGRPIWLNGVVFELLREPLGVVLVIGPFNYPLFLPGVQSVQALVAGNAVIAKPGRGGSAALQILSECLLEAGLDKRLFRVLGESPDEAGAAIEAGVDKVFLTGSETTGVEVLSRLARHTIPSVMELSGDDPVFVRPTADLALVASAIRFGQRFNDGNTCIAPRRVFAPPFLADRLRQLTTLPVIAAEDDDALFQARQSGYALGATVFGEPVEAASFSRRVRAGVVVINDIIVPTADPRVPFGGRGRSGFGVTRGAEGLLEMTALKAILARNTKWLPHLEARHPGDADLFASFLQLCHGGTIRERLRALFRLMQLGSQRR
ncbi:MAG: aldehyde dehydrogenase family protein [Bryobacteraceae bacterium]|nr:aldehyde dehydrogenase family protein [Bryobacteraceae bacterium]